MKYILSYHEDVISEDLPDLPLAIKKRVKLAVYEKLMTMPEVFGKPLRKSLKGYRKLRVGDYRVVFEIKDNAVKIMAILHRSKVYKKVELR